MRVTSFCVKLVFLFSGYRSLMIDLSLRQPLSMDDGSLNSYLSSHQTWKRIFTQVTGNTSRHTHTHAEIDVRRPRAFARLILAETDAYRPATMGGYGVPGSIITIASWLLHFGIDVTGRPAGARIECRCRPRCCSGRPPRRRPCDALFVHKAGAHRHNQSTGTTLRACLCANARMAANEVMLHVWFYTGWQWKESSVD